MPTLVDEITPSIVSSTAGNSANNAVDKDVSTAFTAEGEATLKLHFDKLYFINKIIIYSDFYTNWYNTSDSCQTSEAAYRECKGGGGVRAETVQGQAAATCGEVQVSGGA